MPSNRRAFLTASAVAALATAPAAAATRAPRSRRPHRTGPPATAAEALAELLAGNRRYAAGRPSHPHEDRRLRHALAGGQHPYAVVLGCVDSRVPPELIFDQGLGDVLCLRTAGQVLDEAVLASVQYGVAELRIPLVLVLGHERCGAVAATLDHLRSGADAPGHLELLVEEIAPAAHRTRAVPGDWAEHTMTAHTVRVRDTLRHDPAFSGAQVTAARFDLDTGLVTVLP
ncbi:carbonic anhydrase [Streptomyces roseirectus]|uniref:Carbonic anhydrase n=1 Tax=Streptomyces roseirectus TaxID=2768066 RepID=A0A7H0IHM4_9ACTN|nr:carbonic anhydrase [Streptomyces roseirectus]QNP72290.1 carbonic anhydrase [Streptomyces roseirectus]